MTEFLSVEGGRIAYDVTGSGPLVVLSHGIGDRRQVYRFLAPQLAQAGYRVANADLRGHGESSMSWKSVTGTDAEGDAIAAAVPPGLGEVATVDGAGHYPHAQSPDEVAALVIPFLKQHAGI